jgi:hypothetical protein
MQKILQLWIALIEKTSRVSAGLWHTTPSSLRGVFAAPRDAFRQVYYTVFELFNSKEDTAELLQAVEHSLAVYDD